MMKTLASRLRLFSGRPLSSLSALFLSVLLFPALCLSACSSKETDSSLIPVTLNEVAHSVFYAPQYAAIELGYFEEEGIDLTLVNGGDLYLRKRGRRLRRKLRPADPAGRQFPGKPESRAGFFLGGSERKEGLRRPQRRNAGTCL